MFDDGIDLIIPRGSEQFFVRYIKAHSRTPVLGHGAGICHVYFDRVADLKKAVDVAFDSKVQYPAACNAAETLLVHEDVAAAFLPEMLAPATLVDDGLDMRLSAGGRAAGDLLQNACTQFPLTATEFSRSDVPGQ